MKLRTLILIALLALLPTCLFAEHKNNVSIIPGKKVLNVADFDCPPTTTLPELLELFPELLGRQSNNGLSNYDIQIDGVSTVGSKDETLLQFLASDIKKIEVSQSPDMTQQQKGQGGVINIIPIDYEKGLNGSTALKVGTLAEVAPVAKVNYKTDKLNLRATLMMRYLHPHYDKSTSFKEKLGRGVVETSDSCFGHYGTEHADIHLNYKPDNKNMLKAWVWQSLVRNIQNRETMAETGLRIRTIADSKANNFRINGGAKYTRRFAHSELGTKLEYRYTPTYNWYFNKVEPGISTLEYDEDKKGHNIGGVTDYKYMFKVKDDKHSCDLVGGFNYNYSPAGYDYLENNTGIENANYNAKTSSLYLSPYVEANSKFGAFFLKGGARYQFYHINVSDKDQQQFSRSTNHATAFINFGWEIADHHNLGFNVDRSIRRPSEQQQFPFKVYIPTQARHHLGNAELQPVKVHNIILNYVYDISNNGQDFIVSASAQYITADDLIRSYEESNCIKYRNQGQENTLAGNAMFYYRKGIFSINVLANFFQNWANLDNKVDKYFYYNLSAVPMLHFSRNWNLTARIIYNSHIYTQRSRLSDYVYGQLSISKSWKKWTVGAEFCDLFHKQALDYFYSGDETSGKRYNLRNPSINLTAMFKF